jgi:hypothetical protein
VSAKALEIDERLSWARRDGDVVSVSLRLRGPALETGPATVELVSTSGRVRSQAVVRAPEGTTIGVTVPHAELGRSTWRVMIRTSTSTDFVPIEARLVAAPTCPVALLPGTAPATRMPPPMPKARRSLIHRLAARMPAPTRRVLRRARTWGRTASKHPG